MIDPQEIIHNDNGLVIRLGGNSLTPRHQAAPDYELLTGLLQLVTYCASRDRHVTIVMGGAGGHLFIEWARKAGCSDASINSVGSALIDIGAHILADQFARNLAAESIACSPKPAKSIEELLTLRRLFSVVISGSGIRGAISSDSLALLISEAVRNPVLSIKQKLPFGSITSRPDEIPSDHTCYVTLSEMRRLIEDDANEARAGWHHSLDIWALQLLRRRDARLSFTDSTSIKNFPENLRLTEVLKVTQ